MFDSSYRVAKKMILFPKKIKKAAAGLIVWNEMNFNFVIDLVSGSSYNDAIDLVSGTTECDAIVINTIDRFGISDHSGTLEDEAILIVD